MSAHDELADLARKMVAAFRRLERERSDEGRKEPYRFGMYRDVQGKRYTVSIEARQVGAGGEG